MLKKLLKKMLRIFQLASSFYRKDLLVAMSYRINFLISLVISFFLLYLLYNFSELSFGSSYLKEYKSKEFEYFVLGICVLDFSMIISSRSTAALRNYQLTGTLEELFIYFNNRLALFLLLFTYPIILAFTRFILFILIGVIFFKLELYLFENLLFIILTLMSLSLGFIGVAGIAMSLVLILKKGDFINMLVLFLSVGFGNVLFPQKLLESVPTIFADILPINHAIIILRESMIMGSEMYDMQSQVLSLTTASIILFILGSVLLRMSIEFVEKNNTLSQY